MTKTQRTVAVEAAPGWIIPKVCATFVSRSAITGKRMLTPTFCSVLRCCGVTVLVAGSAANTVTPQHRNTVARYFVAGAGGVSTRRESAAVRVKVGAKLSLARTMPSTAEPGGAPVAEGKVAERRKK